MLLCLAAAGCSSDSPADELADDDRAGEVVALEGEVVAERGGDEVALAVGDDVLAGDTIVTAEGASVTVRLFHNEAQWTLEGGKRRAVRASAAWKAPKTRGGALAGGGGDDRTAAAGRHAEREAADTRATAARSAMDEDRGSEDPAPDPGDTGGAAEDEIRDEVAKRSKLGIVGTRGGDDGDDDLEDVLGEGGYEGLNGQDGFGPARGFGPGGEGQGGIGPTDTEKPPKTKRPMGKVNLDVNASGSLDRQVVRRVARQRIGFFRACYVRSLETDGPQSGGRLVVTFDIDPSGKPGKVTAKVESGSLSTKLRSCVTRGVQRLTFPAADDGAPTSTTITYDFKRAE